MKGSEYKNLVGNRLDYLISKYGFTVIQPFDWSIRFQNDYCEIAVSYHAHSLEVSLRPFGKMTNNVTRFSRTNRIYVANIVKCLDQRAKVELNAPLKTLDEIGTELDKYVIWLQKYCAKMLQGDFSEWDKIIKCIKTGR